jgi:D-glycero-D-manno-heptose 1,7-bisphosphate phosphatase
MPDERPTGSLWRFHRFFYHRPYHPQARIERFRRTHADRKPGPGMILQRSQELDIDKNRSFLIGDKESDIVAARGAGIPTSCSRRES